MFQPLRLTVTPKAAQVALGGHLTLALTVHNASRRHAHYRLAVSGFPADWYDLDQPRISLRPAASALANLSVHPPGGTAVAIAGRYTLTVQVQAEEDPTIHASRVVALLVSTAGGLDMDVQPAQAVGRQGVFRLTFLSQMTWPVYVELAAHDPEDGLRFRIEPENAVVVPAGGVAGPVTVHVVPRARALLGAPHPYEIQFHSLELGSGRRTTRQARFVYVPRYPAPLLPVWLRRAPGRVVLLPVVLLVLLLIVAGSRTLARRATTPPPAPTRSVSSVQPARPRATVPGVPLSRPSIRRFTLVHRRQGQPYELVWQMSGAAHATLDGRPVSARGSQALQAPLHSAIYRLTATNGARRATARLHIVVDAVTSDRHAFVLTTPDIATFAVRRGPEGKPYALWLVRNAVHVWLQGRFVASAGEGLVPPGASRLRLVARNDVGSRQMLLHLASPVPTATPRPRSTATPTLRPTATPRPRPTMTATARPRKLLIAHPTAGPRPTATRTPRPTATPTTRPTATRTPRPTETPTPRPMRTPTPRPTETPTARPTATRTPRPTATPTPRPTATPTPRPTATPTPRPTRTPMPHPTPTPTPMFVTLGTPPPIATVLSTPAAVPTPRPTKTPTPVSVTIGSSTPPATAVATPTAVSVTCCLAQP